MASGELGLKVAFYVYPCVLFVSLLGVQSFQFYQRRQRDATRDAAASATIDKQDAEGIRKFYAWILWLLQLGLSMLLLASVVIAVREAVAGLHDASGKVAFSFSAYLVSFLKGVMLSWFDQRALAIARIREAWPPVVMVPSS
jgi:hypothetical protein